MLPITRASYTPYTAGAPLKYRRADVAPAQAVEDVEDDVQFMHGEYDEAEAMTYFVPLPFKGQLVDKRI